MKNAALAAIFVLLSGCSQTTDFSLIPVSNDGTRWGYINRKGEYVINPQFEDADFFNDGLAKIKSGDGKTGYINKKGEYVIPATYKSGTAFSNGLAFVVADGGLPTCIDKKGNTKFVLNVARYVSAFNEGMAIFANENGEYGFVDKNGNIVVNPQYDMALPFDGGFARVGQKGDAGFIDRTGKITVNMQFKAIGNFSEGKASFSDGKQWGYININGAYAINPQFDDAGKYSMGLAAIKQGRSYGYIDKNGKLLINPQFDQASYFSDGLAAVQSAGKYGYINKKGKYEINTQFEFGGEFYKGVALVRNADKWGFINKKGQYVANPQFNHIKYDTYADARPQFVESDYYDTSEFIKKFFDKEAGNTFDGVNAATTLEALSDHPTYGEGLNARNEHFSEYNARIPITNEIYVNNVRFHFSTPIYTWTVNDYRRRQEFNFDATPVAIVYQLSLNGKAYEKQGAVFNAVKTEIERRQGQPMRSMEQGRELYGLFQDAGSLSFALDASNHTLYVAFNGAYLASLFQ